MQQFRVERRAPCRRHDNRNILLEKKVYEQTACRQIKRDIHAERFLRQDSCPRNLRTEILERISVLVHSGIGTEDAEPAGIRNGGREFSGGNPEHPALQDWILDSKQTANAIRSHSSLIG
jgi:hypothetical protein